MKLYMYVYVNLLLFYKVDTKISAVLSVCTHTQQSEKYDKKMFGAKPNNKGHIEVLQSNTKGQACR